MRAGSWRAIGAGCVVCAGLAIASPRAFAQPASVQAQSLFDEGRKLIDAGKIAEACAAFESSQKLDPAVTTLLNLAECREQNHQLATAWGSFAEANRIARGNKNEKLARVALSHAHKLEPRLSKLTIAVAADSQVAGLEILRDKDPVNPASWNHALPVDGGTYTVTARAAGRTPWSITRTIKIESDTQVIEVPRLAEAMPAAPPPSVSRAAGAPIPGPTRVTPPGGGPAIAASPPGGEPHTVPGSSSPPVARASPQPASAAVPVTASPADQPETARAASRIILVAGAGALAFGGAGLGFFLWSHGTYDRAKSETTDQRRRDALVDSANTRVYIAEGLGVVALGCAGATVYLYLRDRGRGDHPAGATAMTPVASPQFTGLAVTGSW